MTMADNQSQSETMLDKVARLEAELNVSKEETAAIYEANERWRSAHEETDKDRRRFENQVKDLILVIHKLEDGKGAQKKTIDSLEDDVEDLKKALRTMGRLHKNADLRTIWLTGQSMGWLRMG